LSAQTVTPFGLMIRLALYFFVLIGSILAIIAINPIVADILPVGGNDAIEIASLEIDREGLRFTPGRDPRQEEITRSPRASTSQSALIVLYLAISLSGTIAVMVPITWTYMAAKREVGYPRTFVRALIVLPICATTIVLLAAMVAAVRFRVALREAIDGIYIFAAICVGLATGIGYLGIGMLMALFFSFANAILWQLDYGKNPLDDVKRAQKRGDHKKS
jgi:hypothetical protein